MIKKLPEIILILSIAILLTPVFSHSKERDATPEEREKVIEALKAHGCTKYDKEIEFEDDIFETEDVKCSNGKTYDIYLDDNYKIIMKKEEY